MIVSRFKSCLTAALVAAALVPPAPAPAAPGARVRLVDAAAARVSDPSAAVELVRGSLQGAAGADLLVVEDRPMTLGMRLLVVAEERDGLPVHHGEHRLALLDDGTPFALVLGDVADEGSPGMPALSAAEALAIAISEVDHAAADPAQASMSSAGASPGWTTIEMPGRSPAFARLVVHPRGPRVAWRVELGEKDDPEERHAVLVDARTGAVIEDGSLTSHAAARGRVFPSGFLGGSELRDFVDGDVVLAPASPQGWIDTVESIGNNASVWEDRAGDSTTTPGLTAIGTGDPLVFDFPVSGVPLDDLDAALTNVFWAVNDAHDRFWRLGFDEPSGALQTRNFGRGGLAGDYPRVFVQYRAGATATGVRNTSTASTSADGSYASLTFGLWDRSGELRDGALDTGLVFHEYAHLVVVRMLGGDGTCDDGNQPAGLAEGWADYFAAAFTGQTVLGAYVSGQATTGIRTAAIDRSTFTYSNLCATNPASTSCIATENGEIWAGTLWDLRREMLRVHGPAGGARADRLVLEGLRWTPCRPTYLEARDGILLADLALTGGADRCLVWQVMANRGLGYGASSSGPDDRYPIAGYGLGPECGAGAAVAWDRPRYGDDADARVLLSDGRAAGSARTLRVTSSSGDSEDVAAPPPGLVRVIDVPLRPGPAVAGDGLVQVADGGAITVTCVDCAGAPQASAAVSRALAVSVLSHQLSSESCHDDDSEALLADFNNELPSLLDAGELATIAVTLGNGEDFPLEDVRVSVTCDDPAVQVLPRGEIAVGAVDGRYAAPAGFTVSLRALAAAAPAVAFGDVATLTFSVTARGVQGATTLPLELAGDYLAERGVASWGGAETFETSSPSRSAWSHAPAGGEPADLWSLQACGNGGGTAMAYAGPGCTDYADTPSAALLQSPPVFDFSNRVKAVHPLAATWWNDVDLGWAMRSPNYCDSEMVAAYLTDNPSRPNFASPRSDRGSSLQYWVEWPGLGIQRNTGGWVQAFPQAAISTSSVSGMSLPNVRLMWAFFTDVYNPQNDGGCRITDPEGVGGGYKLDDVGFTYDLARVVAASNTTCTRACAVRTVATITPPGGARCAGDVITLSGAGSEAAGCAGTLQYRFTGPGFDSGWIDQDSATATAADGATWAVNVRCSTDTGCSQQVNVADPTKDDVDVGRVRPGTLRCARLGSDVVLSWDGTRSPPSYALFRADSARDDGASRIAGLSDLASPIPSPAVRAGSADVLEWRDPAAAGNGVGLSVYRVSGRLPCAGTPLDR